MLMWMLVGVVLSIIMVLINYSIMRVGSSILILGHPWRRLDYALKSGPESLKV